MKKLVIFFSRADENYFGGQHRYIEVGNTEKAAKMVADITGADIYKLEMVKPYSKVYDECVAQSRQDLRNNARPEFKLGISSIAGYDEIYLGYPNYCGTMPMVVYTFLESFDFNGKTIYPFCTNEGSGLSNTEREIAEIAKGVTVAKGLSINGSRVDSAKPAIEKWLK